MIREVGEEALELGLLFGTESMEEDETDALCFAHLMLQEFVGGLYISEQDVVGSLQFSFCSKSPQHFTSQLQIYEYVLFLLF